MDVEDSQYGYIPHEYVAIIFVVLFGISTSLFELYALINFTDARPQSSISAKQLTTGCGGSCRRRASADSESLWDGVAGYGRPSRPASAIPT
jgi:hypothetical protein